MNHEESLMQLNSLISDTQSSLPLTEMNLKMVDHQYSGNVLDWLGEEKADCTVEILIPDFKGDEKAFETIMQYPPDILNHNLETVKRLYHAVRPQAKYDRSLNLIKWFKTRGLKTKSGIMVGIGEKTEEVLELMIDLYEHGCEIMTMGQYLQPTKVHLPVHRFVTPRQSGQL